jgi:hypothetical protein
MVGPSIREMAAEEARRRAMNDEPHPGDDRWKEEDHPSVLTDTSPDFLTASAEFTELWDEQISHDDFPERI